jgi:methylthioribose-1-phosphate isomerase
VSGLAPETIIRLTGEGVELLDQTRLPGEEATLVCRAWPAVVDAIRRLAIRGAPAIGIAGAMGVALAARSASGDLGAARAEWDRVYPVVRFLLSGGYVGGLKGAMDASGKSIGDPRSPLAAMSPERRSEISTILKEFAASAG